MATINRRGGQKVELFIPVEIPGSKKMLRAVSIGPPRLDHVLRWTRGKINGALGLLSELTKIDEDTLGQLTYPDADRVMAAFLGMLPDAIRGDIAKGVSPMRAPAPEREPEPEYSPADEPPAVPNNVARLHDDGDDDEETGVGFDVGERRAG